MTQFSLPYPGFSWSLSQHIRPATETRTMYELLQAAYVYAKDDNYQDLITQYLIDQGILTPNWREDTGKPNAWRDYQQVLPELGLIFSTRFTRGVRVTPAGMMLLDGTIGYSELITTQALRYQYPNGHKQNISSTLRQLLESSGIEVPATRTQLDASYGVLIKPAILILRVLLELSSQNSVTPVLSDMECLIALVPVKTNTEWQVAVDNLLDVRKNNRWLPRNKETLRRLRHIQEWFGLLNLSDIFQVSELGIRLSRLGYDNIDLLHQLCQFHENDDSFWIPPQGNAIQLGLSWFDYYGTPEIASQWVVPNLTDDRYIQENYFGGVEAPEELEQIEVARERNFEINLQPFMLRASPQLPLFSPPVEVDPQRFAKGQEQRRRSALLHDEIVTLVAQRLIAAGYVVTEDRASVDLLASRDGRETIIEVKTVNRRNLDVRMRLGVGQLSEYRYRRQRQTETRPAGLLVLSSVPRFAEWLRDYFTTDIRLGLASLSSSNSFSAYTQGEIESILTS